MDDLMQFTREILYADAKSTSMAEARATKWKSLKNKSFTRLPPDEDSLRQHCTRANYLSYLIRHPSIKNHPSPIGNGWEIVNGRCRPVRYTKSALPDILSRVDESQNQSNMETRDGEDSSEYDDTEDEDDFENDALEYDDVDSESDDDCSEMESD